MATPTPPKKGWNGRVVVIVAICSLGIACLAGYIVLGALHSTVNTEPLTSIASACVGSLGTYLATMGNHDHDEDDPNTEYELLIGRAASRSLIAEAMRQMGVNSPPPVESGEDAHQ